MLFIVRKKLIASPLNHCYVAGEETEAHNIFKGTQLSKRLDKVVAFIDEWLSTNFIILARDGSLPKEEKDREIPLIQTLIEEDLTEVENADSRIYQETHVSYFQINT